MVWASSRKERKEKKPMPFAASERHEYWTVDIRYLDTPLLGQQAYRVTILDNFSRAIVASIGETMQDLAAYLTYTARRQPQVSPIRPLFALQDMANQSRRR